MEVTKETFNERKREWHTEGMFDVRFTGVNKKLADEKIYFMFVYTN